MMMISNRLYYQASITAATGSFIAKIKNGVISKLCYADLMSWPLAVGSDPGLILF